MKASDIIRCLHDGYKTREPHYIAGPSGIGKTALVKQVADQLGIECMRVLLSEKDISDTQGLPRFAKDGAGLEVTTWARPKWLPTSGNGILFLDEIVAAPALLQVWAYGITNERRSGDYILPDGWVVFGAGNRAQDRCIAHKPSAGLVNRFTMLTMEPNQNDWEQWFMQQPYCVPEITAYLRVQTGSFYDFNGKSWNESYNFACPRSWDRLAKRLNASPEIFAFGKSKDGAKLADKAEQAAGAGKVLAESWHIELVQGIVGPAAGAGFFSFLRHYLELPSVKECLDSPKTAAVPTNASGRHAICTAIVHQVNEKTFSNAMQYISRLPKDFGFFFAKDCMVRHPKLAGTAAFGKWAADNATQLTLN